MLAGLVYYAVVGFAVIAAFNQVGIAAVVVNTLFIGLVASLALAVGLALGLGGREVGAQITQSLYEGGRNMADQAARRGGGPPPPRTARPDDGPGMG